MGNRSDRGAISQPPDSQFDEPVVLPIQDTIDLHAFSPKDIPSVVEEYIDQCCQAGIYELRIIHGRGIGVQRNIVRPILASHEVVLSLRDASPEDGGWWSSVVVWRRRD